MNRTRCPNARLLAVLLAVGSAHAAEVRTQANVPVEVSLAARRDHADPFGSVTVDALVTDPSGRILRVPAFWAGGDGWRFRYASPALGVHRFRTEASDTSDPGLHGVEGTIEVEAYAGANPLFRRGPIRAAADRRHLEHADGTPFFWLGDTWWMGLCSRIEFPGEFGTLTADRVAKGFTVVQIVAGLYPDMPAFDERGANEAGFPWEKDWSRIRPEYFDAADRRIRALVDAGLLPCIVGAWGYFLPWMGVEKAHAHWRYLIARWGALPVAWCIAGEANLPWYLEPGFPFHEAAQVKGWTEVARHVRETDPFRRLVTIHPTGIGALNARGAIDDVSLLDLDMLQTPHGEQGALGPTLRAARAAWAAEPRMPWLDGEASYEMLGDRIPARWPRAMFWTCLLNGAAGHTYGANGIWQCNRRGRPHGASPHGGSYGTIPWDEAMRLPGSTHVAHGKRLLERYPWTRFEPHPEWAELDPEAAPDLSGSRWIWYPEGEPSRDAPAERRFFRTAFALPDGTDGKERKAVSRARLLVSVDDAYSARVNGRSAGSGAGWNDISRLDVTSLLRPGENVIAIIGENRPAPHPGNPAGLIARLELELAGGTRIRIASDGSWRASRAEAAGWDAPGFDAGAWSEARDLGPLGMAPWGRIGAGGGDVVGPQAAGIPDEVRIVWMPGPDAVVVRELGSGTSWRARWFDPCSGTETAIEAVLPDAEGRWRCPPPAGAAEDWVLVLERAR